MPRATCRCGHPLNIPVDGDGRIVCANCGAKVRIRRSQSGASGSTEDGGFLRFNCPCGRRLKVVADGTNRPTHGKCPDCGRVVPVPATGLASRVPESPTEELSTADAEAVAAWSKRHLDEQSRRPSSTHVLPTGQTPWKSEAGLRVCPGCGRPVHLGASICRDCGSAVPKR